MGRVIMEANGPEALERVFGPTLRRFVAAVRRAAPHLSENEARLRMHLAVGSMVFAVSVPRFAAQVPQRLDDLRGTVDQLVNFAAAGLVAPSVSPARKETP